MAPNSLLCLLLSSSSAFFSPAASLIKAALVNAGFLIDPLPDWLLERVVALASSSGSHSLEKGGGERAASPCLRKAVALALPRLFEPAVASLAELLEALWLPSALANMFESALANMFESALDNMLEETGDVHGENGEPIVQGGREACMQGQGCSYLM